MLALNGHRARIMKLVDLIGKRTALPSLTQIELKEILTPLYYKAYKNDLL